MEIGKGGDKLVPSILGNRIEQEQGESLRQAHTAVYTRIAESKPMRSF